MVVLQARLHIALEMPVSFRIQHFDKLTLNTFPFLLYICHMTQVAIYGYFTDIIGHQFFPPTNSDATSIIKSFLVFSETFLAWPVGGVLMGWVWDAISRKSALELSIFLMAIPLFAMGCLPTFERVGWWAVVLLVVVRLMQGLSAGGQLMSSLVFSWRRVTIPSTGGGTAV